MSTAANQLQRDSRIKLVEEHLRAENDHDVEAIMATFCQNPTFQLNATHLNDYESIHAMYTGFGFSDQGSFSSVKAQVTKQHVADESVVTEILLTGKHTGSWQGIPPTNREFSIPLIAIFEFDGEGKLAGERVFFDGALMMQQLGLL